MELRRSWPLLQALLRALLLATVIVIAAACGDGSQTENVVNTIDGDLEIVETPRDGVPEIGDDNGVAVDTIGGLDVPAAAPAEPPSDEYRPSERQARQELAVSEIEVLPEPVVEEDADARASDVGEASDAPQFTIRPDIGSFPASIPVMVPGSDGTTSPLRDRVASAPAARQFDPTAPGADAPIEDAVAQVTDELSGIVPAEATPRIAVDEPAAGEVPDSTVDDCVGIAGCDPNSEAAGGDGVVTSSTQTGADVGAGEPDCDTRPWARGCPGPAPDHVGATDVDDASFADTTEVDVETDDGEGVYVPQEIQDALLAPVDADDAKDSNTDDDADSDRSVDGESDETQSDVADQKDG